MGGETAETAHCCLDLVSSPVGQSGQSLNRSGAVLRSRDGTRAEAPENIIIYLDGFLPALNAVPGFAESDSFGQSGRLGGAGIHCAPLCTQFNLWYGRAAPVMHNGKWMTVGSPQRAATASGRRWNKPPGRWENRYLVLPEYKGKPKCLQQS